MLWGLFFLIPIAILVFGVFLALRQLIVDPRHAPAIVWATLTLFGILIVIRLSQPAKGSPPPSPTSLRGRILGASITSEQSEFGRALLSLSVILACVSMVLQSRFFWDAFIIIGAIGLLLDFILNVVRGKQSPK